VSKKKKKHLNFQSNPNVAVVVIEKKSLLLRLLYHRSLTSYTCNCHVDLFREEAFCLYVWVEVNFWKGCHSSPEFYHRV